MSDDILRLKSNFNDLLARYEKAYIFDVETTGLNKWYDEIIEITLAELKSDGEGTWIGDFEDYYISLPSRSLPAIIVGITGITDAFLSENGRPRAFVAQKVIDRINSEKTLLVAHNANFDMNFLLATLHKEKRELDLRKLDVVDTLTIFKDRRPYPHKLSDAINAYGLSELARNSHRSIDDVRATALVLDAMRAELCDIDRYINLIGYNPKYGIKRGDMISSIRYLQQPYNSARRLYENT